MDMNKPDFFSFFFFFFFFFLGQVADCREFVGVTLGEDLNKAVAGLRLLFFSF